VPPQQSFPSCCAITRDPNFKTNFPKGLNILDDAQTSTRNARFKLVEREVPDCSIPAPVPPDKKVTEFYAINEVAPIPRIDREDLNLCSDADCQEGLNAEQRQNFNVLSQEMKNIVKSEVPCIGDGNEDKKVNGKDIKDWDFFFRQTNPLSAPYNSSWYDFNHDGYTDMADLQVIREHFGTNCEHSKDDENEALEENESP
jgi:hypothetical protein